MKLLITSDWHIDSSMLGIPRVGEIDEYVDRLCHVVRDQKIEMVAVLGDYFDVGGRDDLRHADRLERFAGKLERYASTIWITGNHDVTDTRGPTALTMLGTRMPSSRNVFEDRPIHVTIAGTIFMIYPYVSREAHAEAKERAEIELEACARIRGNRKVTVLSHWYVPEAKLDNESVEFMRGPNLWLPIQQIAEKLGPDTTIFQGHYHKPQAFKSKHGPTIVIPGSPVTLTFQQQEGALQRGAIVVNV